jgi:hypothetical protein
MTSLNDAFQPILLKKFPENIKKDSVVGVLLGKVVNSAYYINLEKDEKKYYTTNDENKKIKLDITLEDHGKEIELPLVGKKYKIVFYNTPYTVK